MVNELIGSKQHYEAEYFQLILQMRLVLTDLILTALSYVKTFVKWDS